MKNTEKSPSGFQLKITAPFAMETLIGYILLSGVLISMALIATGIIWNWLQTGRLTLEYPIIKTNLFGFMVSSIREVLAGILHPRLFVSLGIIALMLTPYTRVLASVLYFALAEHNIKYTLFTAFVLSVLTYSLFLG